MEYHEWFGAGMLVLFSVHNILNYRCYENILKKWRRCSCQKIDVPAKYIFFRLKYNYN